MGILIVSPGICATVHMLKIYDTQGNKAENVCAVYDSVVCICTHTFHGWDVRAGKFSDSSNLHLTSDR